MADPELKRVRQLKEPQPKVEGKGKPVAANVIYFGKGEVPEKKKPSAKPRVQREFIVKKGESPIAKAFSSVPLTDKAAGVVQDFIDTKPPSRQLQADLGIILAREVYDAWKGGVIESPTEAIRAMSVVRAIYGASDSSQQAQFNEYLKRIVDSGEVNSEGLRVAAKTLGVAAPPAQN